MEAVGLDGTGWFTEDPDEVIDRFGGVWRTADFRAGDILLFTMRTVHMSTTNTTRLARISCDTRWHGRSKPADPRYVGAGLAEARAKFGLNNEDKAAPSAPVKVTMKQKKSEWGFL